VTRHESRLSFDLRALERCRSKIKEALDQELAECMIELGMGGADRFIGTAFE
jgi:hypothetical protein